MTSDSAALDLLDRKTVAQIGLGFVVAGAVIALLVDFVGTEGVLAGLRRADLRWLAVACLSTAICLTAWGKADTAHPLHVRDARDSACRIR